MLPDHREFQYQMHFRRQEILQEREKDRLRRIALEARRQKTARRSFSLARWFRRLLPDGTMPANDIVPDRRPAEEGGLS